MVSDANWLIMVKLFDPIQGLANQPKVCSFPTQYWPLSLWNSKKSTTTSATQKYSISSGDMVGWHGRWHRWLRWRQLGGGLLWPVICEWKWKDESLWGAALRPNMLLHSSFPAGLNGVFFFGLWFLRAWMSTLFVTGIQHTIGNRNAHNMPLSFQNCVCCLSEFILTREIGS